MSRVLVDLTPIAGAHGIRGIGSYVRGLQRAIASDPTLADEVVGFAAAPLEGIRAIRMPRWLAVRPQDIGVASGVLAETLALRAAHTNAFHQTDPRRPLRPRGATRLAVTAYDLIPLETGSARGERFHRRLVYRLYLRSLQQADRIIAISTTTAAAVASRLGIDPDRIDVVPPVIEADTQIDRAPSGADPAFLFVGVPDPHKRPELGIAALAEFRRRHHAGSLTFIGPMTAAHRAHLAAIAAGEGVSDAVMLRGRVSDAALALAWSTATTVLALSELEGFGLPPVEAALRGVPVVAVDTRIARETLGPVALYVVPDPASIADAMEAATPPTQAMRSELAARYSPRTAGAALRHAYGRLREG